jgi:hypothetical protein
MNREMHESNEMFQALAGKTVERIDYVDDFGEGISVVFTDGSVLTVSERMQAGMLEVYASINEGNALQEIKRTKARWER